MRILQGRFVLPAALALSLSGCFGPEAPSSPAAPAGEATAKGAPAAGLAADPVLAGYVVHYVGRVVANNRTTFTYNVHGAGSTTSSAHVSLQIPACAGALADYSPQPAVLGLDPTTGISGIHWNFPIHGDDAVGLNFSVTFAGDVPEGVVRFAVKAGTDVGRGVVTGPCQGFLISGTLYVDSDSSGTRNAANEPGSLANVTVALVDAAGGTATTTTAANGTFAFKTLDGTFTLRIDAATSAVDFNEDLFASFFATTTLTRVVTVGPDSPNNDFGFKPQAKKVIAEVQDGTLPTDGLPAKFWLRELRGAVRSGTGPTYSAATLLGFLNTIEGLFFPVPYQFDSGVELQQAIDQLSHPIRTNLDALIQALLVTELNHVSGHGLVGEADLQAVLLSWAESVVIANTTSGATAGPVVSKSSDTLAPDIGTATTLLNSINSSRGGDIPAKPGILPGTRQRSGPGLTP
jgi:hypothetical protein